MEHHVWRDDGMRAGLGWLLLLLSAWGMPMPSMAWTQLGHALVGDLANQQLTVATRQRVAELLEGERDATLGGVASWADALRYSDPRRFRATTPWHYINARGGGCDFDEARDCRNGDCIVSVIRAQERILADPAGPRLARQEALKFLVHLIGDVHQPLHANSRTDAGGNRFQVSLRTPIAPEDYARDDYRDGVMGTNLHAIWDYYILEAAGLDRRAYVSRLSATALRAPARPATADPMVWARESCALVEARGIYPASHTLDHRYLDQWRPFVEERVGVAAARLAAVLNQALGQSRSRSR